MGLLHKAVLSLLFLSAYVTLGVNCKSLKNQNDDHHHHHDRTTIAPTTSKADPTTRTAAPTTTNTPPTTRTAAPTTTTPAPTTTTASPKVYCDSEYSCFDHYTPRICKPTGDGRYEEKYTFRCPKAARWCDPESFTCTSVEPPAYGHHSNFTCMMDGYFPDVKDCSSYYRCENSVALAYTCAGNTPYYVQYFEACKGAMYASWCADQHVNCSGRTGVKLAVGPRTPDMFVYCIDGKAKETVDKCEAGYKFDAKTETCQPSCPHEGLFPSDQDCRLYYRCTPATSSDANNQFIMSDFISCPDNQGFSKEEYMCVDKSLLSYC